MKKYKLLKDLPTFKAGETFYLDDCGNLCADKAQGYPQLVAYAASTLRKFPHILGGWFEEIKGNRLPQGRPYYYLDDRGVACYGVEGGSRIDNMRWRIGNYFDTEAAARRAARKLEAYATAKRDTDGFEPDWEELVQWCVSYNYDKHQLEADNLYGWQHSGNIIFASQEATEKSLEVHRAEWELLFDLDEGKE